MVDTEKNTIRIFQKPNTEWKERDITLNDGRILHYVFGEGNPEEVALDQSKYAKQSTLLCTKRGNTINSLQTFCNPEMETLQYITPEIEKHLSDGLSDPHWTNLMTICENNLRFMETRQKEQGRLTFDELIQTRLEMEDFLLVDLETGWKKLNEEKIGSLVNFIEQGRYLYGRGEVTENPYGDCVDRYGWKILKNLRSAELMYQNHPFTTEEGSIGTTYGQIIQEYVLTGAVR